MYKIISFLVLLFLSTACGRMRAPYAPEDLAAKSVNELTIVASDNAVQFTWLAPDADVKGEKLRSLDGYLIQRKDIKSSSDVVDESISFETVGEVSDRYFAELKRKQEFLRGQGLPVRRATVDESVKTHSFSDTTVELGKRYLYKVIPLNQGGEEGEVASIVDVDFNGLSSEIILASVLEYESDLADE